MSTHTDDPVYLQRNGAVATLVLNRPETRNALNEEMILSVPRLIRQAENTNGIRVLVIRGNGKVFCAGADLGYMQRVSVFSFDENYSDSLQLAELFRSVSRTFLPVITRVQGYAMGGAIGIVAASDIVIADDTARFAFSEVRLGLVPGVIAPFVMQKMNPSKAREWMLTGAFFSAAEALDAGLVHVSAGEEESESLLAERINHLLKASPMAIRYCKELLQVAKPGSDIDQVLPVAAKFISLARSSEEGREGLRAFFEKRPPEWVPDAGNEYPAES